MRHINASPDGRVAMAGCKYGFRAGSALWMRPNAVNYHLSCIKNPKLIIMQDPIYVTLCHPCIKICIFNVLMMSEKSRAD